jgi:hypothetical protein
VHLAEVGTCDACLRSGRQRVNVGLALGVTLPGTYLGLARLAGLPHPELERATDRRDGFVLVGPAVELAHAHAAQAD